MSSHLEIDGLTVALPPRGTRPFAVEGASLSIRRGEVLCVVGESGSGKSALASAIIGLLPDGMSLAGGRIRFADIDLTKLAPAEMRDIRGARIATIMQEPAAALNPLLTIGEQIEDVLLAHRKHTASDRRQLILEMLEAMHLPDPIALSRRFPHQLSGGQRQRAVIAKALILEPELLIADEPTTALDVSTQAQVLSLLLEAKANLDLTVLFVTHDIGVVSDIADSVVVMHRGRVVEDGPVRTILDSPRELYTQQLINALPKFEPISRRLVSTEPIVTVEGLSKSYAARTRDTTMALNNVSCTVRRGETLAVVGESGSGKSTLARCIVGLTSADAGSIRFEGHDLARLSRKDFRPLRSRIQMIFQDPGESLNPLRSIGEAITEGPISLGMAREEARRKTLSLLSQVGLGENAYDRRPSAFSGGERQRIAIARALIHDPSVLIADEPVSALDVTVQATILELLEQFRKKRQITMLFITHDLRVAARLADCIMILRAGRVVEMGPASRILSQPEHPYSRTLIEAIPGTSIRAGGVKTDFVSSDA